MSFSKAAIRRFNEGGEETPGPNSYRPKELPKGSGVACFNAKRFTDVKQLIPGPGHYDVKSANDLVRKKTASGLKQTASRPSSVTGNHSSRSSSTCSLNTDELFKTPSRIPPKADTSALKKTIDHLKTTNDQLELELKEKLKQFQALESKSNDEQDSLRAEIDILTSKLDKESAELSANIDELEQLKVLFDEADKKVQKSEESLDEAIARIESLKSEVELLNQDNTTLEEKLEAEKNAIETERKSLEEKCTFLHFTQEQLNEEIKNMEGQCQQLQARVDKVETELTEKCSELEQEKNKLQEFTDVCVKENREMEEDFKKMKAQNEDLKTQVETAKSSNAQLTDDNLQLEEELKESKDHLCQAQTISETLQVKLETMEVDLEVANNDKGVLESELQRLESEKMGVEFDLATITKEKIQLQNEFDSVLMDKDSKELMLKQLQDQGVESEFTLEQSRAKIAKFEHQLAQLYEQAEDLQATIADKQNIVDDKERAINEFRSELEELGVRNSSLEGALSSSQNEVTNLEAENKTLLNSFESVEETLRSYIHTSQDLTIEVETLKAAKADLNETCVILEGNVDQLKDEIADNKIEMSEMVSKIEEGEVALEFARKCSSDFERKAADLQELVGLLEQRARTDQEIHQELSSQHEREADELKTQLASLHSKVLDLEQGAKESSSHNSQLLEMNDELSTQLSDNLHTIKSLQDREQELNKRLDFLKSKLDSAEAGMAVELDNHWQAEDEILHLQSELDQLSIQLKESKQSEEKLRQDVAFSVREKMEFGEMLESTKAEFQCDISSLKTELEEKLRQLESLSTVEQSNEELVRKLKALETNLKTVNQDGEENHRLLSKMEAEMTDKQATITDQRQKILQLEDDLDGADEITIKFKEMETLLEDYVEECSTLEEQVKLARAKEAEQSVLVENLRKQLEKDAEEQSYKEKFEALTTMIEPFKDQLESFEMEREALVSRNEEVQGEVKKLASQYGQLLGHQNHKQKIQHLVKLKQENVSMREEMAKMRLELDKYRRLALKHEKIRSSNKENASMLRTPINAGSTKSSLLSSIKKPDFNLLSCVTPRRQTIGSPLSDKNRPL